MRSEEKRLKDRRALEDSRRMDERRDENSRSFRGDDRRMDRRYDDRDRERDSRRVDERDRRADDRDREISNNSFNNSNRRNYYEKERRSERTEEKEKRYGPREEVRPVPVEPKRAPEPEREIPKPKAEPLINFVSEAAKMKLNETASMKEAKRGWESDYGMFSEREEQHAGSGEFDFEWTKNYHTPSVVIQDKEDASVLNEYVGLIDLKVRFIFSFIYFRSHVLVTMFPFSRRALTTRMMKMTLTTKMTPSHALCVNSRRLTKRYVMRLK